MRLPSCPAAPRPAQLQALAAADNAQLLALPGDDGSHLDGGKGVAAGDALGPACAAAAVVAAERLTAPLAARLEGVCAGFTGRLRRVRRERWEEAIKCLYLFTGSLL
jgi:hypothetical protein